MRHNEWGAKMKKQNHPKGQATIELLLILSVLFILLGLSLNIAANQQTISNQKNGDFSLTRNAQQIANALTFTSSTPIGTKTHVFLAPGPAQQTFIVQNGVLEGSSNQSRVLIPLPSKGWYSAPIYDGNYITLTKDWNTVVVQAGYR